MAHGSATIRLDAVARDNMLMAATDIEQWHVLKRLYHTINVRISHFFFSISKATMAHNVLIVSL